MPRHDFATPLVLTSGRITQLAEAIAEQCADADILTAALERYPGNFDPSDLSHQWTPKKKATETLSTINKEWNARPLLSRLMEEGWGKNELRIALLSADPTLVLAPTGLNLVMQDVVAGVEALLSLIAPHPSYGQVGDPRAFVTVGSARRQFESLHLTLGYLKALKDAHDALHALQLASASWLDDDDDEDANAIVLGTAPLAQRVGDALAAIRLASPRLPIEAQALGQRCTTELATIRSRLAHAERSQQIAGLEQLRALLTSEPRLIDEAIFSLAKTLPIRDLGRVFKVVRDPPPAGDPEMERYWKACIYLGEAIRGRVLEHGFWQSSDVRLDIVEALLATPPPDYFKRLIEAWAPVQFAMAFLLEPAPGREPIDRLVNLAILEHEAAIGRAAGPTTDPDEVKETREEIARTFGAFKTEARALFLAVDKALMQDLATLSSLQERLSELLRRVTIGWQMNLLPQWQTRGWGI
jgi:hypothetical protein